MHGMLSGNIAHKRLYIEPGVLQSWGKFGARGYADIAVLSVLSPPLGADREALMVY